MKKIMLFLTLMSVVVSGKEITLEKNPNLKYFVNTDTLEVKVKKDNREEVVSIMQDNIKATKIKNTEKSLEFVRGNKSYDFILDKNYLDIKISTSKVDEKVDFPIISEGVKEFILPLNQGRRIPRKDKKLSDYLVRYQNGKFTENFSMNFIGSKYKEFSTLFIVENPFDSQYFFSNKDNLKFTFIHNYPIMENPKIAKFRIYILSKDINDLTTTYKKYLLEKNDFKTLKEKEKENPNIKKLYNSPHMYLWGNYIISKDSIKNAKQLATLLKKEILYKTKLGKEIKTTLKNYGEEKNFYSVLDSKEKFYSYRKTVLANGINYILNNSNLSSKEEKISDSERIEANKIIFYKKYKPFLEPVATWGDGFSNYILDELQKNKIKKAWLGLDSWKMARGNNETLKRAKQFGYLIGPYDSYHTITKKGDKKGWETTEYGDDSIYENDTITGKNGEKLLGFQRTGRKLNPTKVRNLMIKRTDEINKNTNNNFNSWFLDVDGTGEFHNDYTKGSITNEKQDMEGRIKKMEFFSKEKKKVLGTENGFGFASKYIAFSHGLVNQLFGWGDMDLRHNPKSKYYFGKYYNLTGGVPKIFSKKVPLKDIYKYVYFNSKFDLPLFKMVYNDSVISTYHWLMGTLKFKDQRKRNELKEISFNIPPLYHLDRDLWKKTKKYIVPQVNFFSKYNDKLLKLPMTNFSYLSSDYMLQSTTFGESYKIITNYSKKNKTYKGIKIIKESLVIINLKNNTKESYTPL